MSDENPAIEETEPDEGTPLPMPYTEEAVQDDGSEVEDPPGYEAEASR